MDYKRISRHTVGIHVERNALAPAVGLACSGL